MGRICSIAVLLILFLRIPSACSVDGGDNIFITAEEKNEDGRYEFPVDMSDTASVYTVGFYSRVDRYGGVRDELQDIPLEIRIISPSGRVYEEKVYLPGDRFADGVFPSRDIVADYRTGTRPFDGGKWKFSVHVVGDESIKGFRGLGIYVKKMPYGKR